MHPSNVDGSLKVIGIPSKNLFSVVVSKWTVKEGFDVPHKGLTVEETAVRA